MDGAFIVGWELQSHFSSVALIAFARFGSVGMTIPIMLIWSVVTTIAFYQARRLGRPDLLERTSWGTKSRVIHVRFLSTMWSALKAWLAGIQAFIYARLFARLLQNSAIYWHQRAAKFTVLGFGLTVFGVPTAHHLLSKAGYRSRSLLKFALVAVFLNVPFRVLASSFLVQSSDSLVGLPI
jgi:hypothetical protein